jgi:RNA polymerase sigma factor (sigma-70 family)
MQKYTFEKFTQEEIQEGLRINDSKILKWLYQMEFPKLERFILNNKGNEQHAKDIYQEAFVALWKNVKADKFKPENGTAIQGYLFQIGKNKWLDYLRSSKYKNTVPLENYHDGSQEESEDRESELKQVEISFKNLGENCKELLTRFYFKKESMAIIAQAFNWTEATARNNKYRCIQRLKEKMKIKI